MHCSFVFALMKLDVALATEILPVVSERVWAEYYRQRPIGIREIHRSLFLAPMYDACVEFLGRLIDCDVNEQLMQAVTDDLDLSVFAAAERKLVRNLLVDAVRKQLVDAH
jgi:hypothetical protein